MCESVEREGRQSETVVSGNAQAGLMGALAKFANIGVAANGQLNNREYRGVLQEQLASALKETQNCRLEVLRILSNSMLPSANENRSVGPVLAQFEADVTSNCRKLQAWPTGNVQGEDVVAELGKLLQYAEYQNLGQSARNYATLAMLNRCMGAGYLISKGEPMDKIRTALIYLPRSLAFDPQQALLRDNIASLDSFIKNRGGNITVFLTTILQVLRGSNDPDIPALVQTLEGVAKSTLQKQ
jgi:hypothetical protein